MTMKSFLKTGHRMGLTLKRCRWEGIPEDRKHRANVPEVDHEALFPWNLYVKGSQNSCPGTYEISVFNTS